MTITAAVHELIARGLVMERRDSVPTGGRRARLLDLAPSAGCVLAADIGAINVRLAAADLRGQLIAKRTVSASDAHGHRRFFRLLKKVRDSHPGPVLAIGIGIAGNRHADGSLSLAESIRGWDGVDFAEALRPFDAPVFVENESNLAALGEYLNGHLGPARNVIFVAIGAGIGSGIILDGQLYRGRDGLAGEIGDMRFLHGHPLTLEQRAGVAGLCERYRAHGGEADEITAETIFARAADGEHAARSAIAEVSEELALALANVTVLLNPEAIVIGGGMAEAGEALFDPIRRTMRSLVHDMPEIRASPLGSDATIVGAAMWAAQHARDGLVDMISQTTATAYSR